MTATTAVDDTAADAATMALDTSGDRPLGRIDISSRAVEKIAARAAGETPDAGAPARRVLGRSLPGTTLSGPDLDALPRTTVDVDGSVVVIALDLSVRWPCSIVEVTEAVREHVRQRVSDLTGMRVAEVNITVSDLVTDLPTPARVQ